MSTYHLDELELNFRGAEPMAWRLEVPGAIEPDRWREANGIGSALGEAADAIERWEREGGSDGVLAYVFHGPMQDDEAADVCEASFRLAIGRESGRVTVEALDHQARLWLEAC